MKKCSTGLLTVLFLLAFAFSVSSIVGWQKDDKNPIVLIDKGLALWELDSVSVEDVYARRVVVNDYAINHFMAAYDIIPSSDYVRYCLAASWFFKREYQKVLDLLGLDWRNAQYSFLQVEAASALCDSLALRSCLVCLIANKPDVLESPFWDNVSTRFPSISAQAVSEAHDVLVGLREDVFGRARLAKLEMSLGNIDVANELLLEVASEMPNLSRPWAYWACLQMETDSVFAKLCLERSLAIDPLDAFSVELLSVWGCDDTSVSTFAPPLPMVLSVEQAFNSHFRHNTIIISGLRAHLNPNPLKLISYVSSK